MGRGSHSRQWHPPAIGKQASRHSPKPSMSSWGRQSTGGLFKAGDGGVTVLTPGRVAGQRGPASGFLFYLFRLLVHLRQGLSYSTG